MRVLSLIHKTGTLTTCLLFLSISLSATRLVEVLAVDNQCLALHWQDGYVQYNWDDPTSEDCNGWETGHTLNSHLCKNKDQYVAYGQPLATEVLTQRENFRLLSAYDSMYGEAGQAPLQIYRKSKVWEASVEDYVPVMHHWVYLVLPSPLQRGKLYTLQLPPDTQSDQTQYSFTFNEYQQRSPAIKISNIGYESLATHQSAVVYLWMGDGGGRDFHRFQGKRWHLWDVAKKRSVFSGTLALYKHSGSEPYEKQPNFTQADVWECDFSAFKGEGQFKLVIEGVGCSPVFPIKSNAFEEAFKVSMQGMFYQRMGCDAAPAGGFPKARRPLYRQGIAPDSFTVWISQKDMVRGKNPDDRKFYSEALTGEVAPATWGGWSDAYDNDQRPPNYICVFDLLLAYYLHPEAFTDNQLYIPEQDNGIPDIIDEALWEIDWWLRMRDAQGGYLSGLTNIDPPERINYAGAPCAWQAWAVAAGCAMVADCFRIAGNEDLQEKYLQEALAAYAWAEQQRDSMLAVKVDDMRGKDLKMTAAAFLYNLTGESTYETLVQAYSEVHDTRSRVKNLGLWEQQYATLAYLLTPQVQHHPRLAGNMRASLLHQARVDYVDKMAQSPTKAARWAPGWEGMFQTCNEVSLVAIAHKLTKDVETRAYLEKGLYAEAEWTLGRNPLGLIQMTGFGARGITQTFAPGRRDGYPGLTPGWTPYMCRDGWHEGDHPFGCKWYTKHNYPTDKTLWPWGEQFWNSRYSVPNSEATPQQNFRQKVVLYGYLYGMNRG